MIRRPPKSTQSRSSAASDVYKRQHSPTVTFSLVVKLARPEPRSYLEKAGGKKEREIVILKNKNFALICLPALHVAVDKVQAEEVPMAVGILAVVE